MNKRLLKSSLAALCAFALSACTYTGTVRSNIAPMAASSRTYKGDVSLMIDRDITSAEVTTGVGAHTVKVAVGSALNSAIVEAARIVFPSVAPQGTSPTPGTYDVLLRARLQHMAASSTIEAGFWTARASITAQASVVIEMLRGDGSIAHRQVVTGTGLENRPVGTPDNVRQGVEVALERAVQQVADGAASVFMTGLSDSTREQFTTRDDLPAAAPLGSRMPDENRSDSPSGNRWTRLRLAMTKNEVRALIGSPNLTTATKWYYANDGALTFSEAGKVLAIQPPK